MKRNSPFILVILLLAACAHPKALPTLSSGKIVQVNILTAPVGLNVDNRPGADGFSVKVYANDDRNPKTVRIDSGRLEILMFNGTFFGKTNLPAPAKTWAFEAAALPQYQVKSTIGVGYDFFLEWKTNAPTERLITVLARFTAPDNRVILSPESSVTVLEK